MMFARRRWADRGALLAALSWCLVALLPNPLSGQENSDAINAAGAETDSAEVDFNQQIRPIFTQYCSSCHGGVKQAGDVSFVYRDQVLPPDGWVVEPGDPEASVLIERIKTEDPDLRMPPPDEHPDPLPAEAIALLERWILEGATWGEHWSMAPLEDPLAQLRDPLSPPAEQDGAEPNGAEPSGSEPDRETAKRWGRQPLDRIVAAQHTQVGVRPSAEADPAEWLRRVSFDLIGLPPTLQQTREFVSRCQQASTDQDRESLYVAQVEQLLASPAFGERWASLWMDLARYADSKGFEKDPHRDMWPYRDWLIRAFNEDMPYDQFTIKQLAGDLLPEPTADDWIATAFHRNTQTNTEGGTDDEEFRVAAVIDRINTTWTVWQATTMGCVQCHSHPYDPLRQDEYYSFMALFNNSLDCDLDSDYPTLVVPEDREQIAEAVQVQRAYQEARRLRNQLGRDLAEQLPWQPLTPRSAVSSEGELKIEGNHVRRAGGTFPVGVQYTIEADAPSMTAMRVEILPESQEPAQWPEQGSVLSRLKLTLVAEDGSTQPIELADVFADALTVPDDPRDCLSERGGDAVGGYPKLNGPRWGVFVLKQPLRPPASSTLRLEMIQSASVTGNLATPLRNFVCSVSDDDGWQTLLGSDALRERTETLAATQQSVQGLRGGALPVVLSRPQQAARPTRRFIRGNWTDRGDEMAPGIPAAFAESSSAVETIDVTNRLDLARWLVSKANPLAARVWANRIWAQLFGIGIVETQEDFGSSGTLPSNSALLDYLAISIRDTHGWRLKPFLRELVLSATYRQTQHVDKALQDRDPENRLLARGPRTRLTAEMLRDQALAVSGLLTREIGGVSVMPPQPEGVWQTVYSGSEWKTAEGANRYRRALYTYWRRTSPYPSFLMFDAPTRDLCSARRVATNTPLQALVTLNDPVYVECSQALAKRAAEEAGDDPGEQVAWMYAAVTQRTASPSIRAALVALWNDLVSQSTRAPAGESPISENPPAESPAAESPASQDATADDSAVDDAAVDDPAHATESAMAVVANTILNLDRALTK